MFLDRPLSPLTSLDGAVLAALTLVLVADAFITRRRMKALDAERPGARLAIYRESILFLWAATVVLAAAWAISGRSFRELGVDAPLTPPFVIGAGVALAGCMALALQVAGVRASAEARAQVARQVAIVGKGVSRLLPRTQTERLTFTLVAATAGIGEEIIFRGFLIWALAHWTPIWVAALLSTALFTLGHLYQEGWPALARVALTGAIFAVLTIFSGSLLPAMLLHFAVDWSSGESAWAARQEIASAPAGTQ